MVMPVRNQRAAERNVHMETWMFLVDQSVGTLHTRVLPSGVRSCGVHAAGREAGPWSRARLVVACARARPSPESAAPGIVGRARRLRQQRAA